MISDFVKSIVSRYQGEYAPEATNRTIPPDTTLTIGISARDPWIPYVYRIGGYCNNQNLAASFLDSKGVNRFSWSSWPDSNNSYEMTPLVPNYRLEEQGTYNGVIGNFFLVFDNGTQDNVDLSASFEMFLIDEAMAESFEAEFKNLYLMQQPTPANQAEFIRPSLEGQIESTSRIEIF